MPGELTHHFGRGGAGNVTNKDDKGAVVLPESTTPTLKSKNYTTGRGGTGNIVKNENPENARKAQDMDVPGIVLPENEYHTGRGGEGNRVKPSDDELAAARQNNEQVRSASFTKDRSGLKGFADKAKDVLRPND
ncbi:hypothetical protein LTR70_004612 [Exophiala xenobiotica]|uniref:Uncharacterized protein n=1 Tax=Lithohypha guttulata TaxID=1690604 RepID=A0ABR0KCS6_9EURO|nr:hypothetical protein LTR24_004131 [Lithohypha guttulata]KAK5320385.1 hypothetical protein LTR70_004612 [Exophiala xenobiotica]